MTDMRRTILWVVFSASLFLLWDAWNKHNGHPSLFNPGPAKTAPAAGATPASGGVPGAASLPAAGGVAAATPAAPAASGAAAVAGEKISISTDVLKATLDTRGGDLVYLSLNGYADSLDPKQRLVLFDQSARRQYEAQTGLITTQPGAVLPNHLTLMTVAPGERTLKDGADVLTVSFESPDVGGVKLVKTYTFKRGQYTVAVTHEVRNTGTAVVQPQLYLQLERDGTVEGNTNMFAGPTSYTGAAIYTDKAKYQKVDFTDIAKGKNDHEKASDNGWIAIVQHYFATAWLVAKPGPREFRTAKLSDNHYAVSMVLPLGDLAPGATVKQDAVLFAGPQEEKKLEALAPGLELVKDYGMLTILSKPLFWLLDKLHGIIGNWGWAIVALVVLLKIAFYALNAHAYKSMAKMKAVNPKVQDMRERYKDKPQQMQQEMMRIYREEKVNPIGGCLPIFIQMPFFIALYWVLLSTVEMRDAPWIGWIHDLSTKDPLYILPLVMTASTMFQTWLNPTPPDPVQARMMWIMPLVFSVMFFFFPAGLVLYWVTNNILGIAQQWFINKQLGLNTKK